jgi:hypothetical protein
MADECDGPGGVIPVNPDGSGVADLCQADHPAEIGQLGEHLELTA